MSHPAVETRRRGAWAYHAVRQPLFGPLVALTIALVVFSAISPRFLTANNLSLVFQQSIVIGILAVGQTLVILTAGIDLSIGAVTVLGTLVMAKVVADGNLVVAFATALVVCLAAGSLNGALVTRLSLPPFIVTLGTFTIIAAASQLYAGSRTYPVQPSALTWLGTQLRFGSATVTYGVFLMLASYVVVWYMLSRTAWGKHVYAVGGNPEAARLTGIKVRRVLFSVYAGTGFIAVLAAWAALGRIPNADPNAFQNANLESITAVVIGGTSMFGGRGGVMGTLVGTLIVGVLRNGLTLAGVDNLYQNIATGVLVILAVTVDQFIRRRSQ